MASELRRRWRVGSVLCLLMLLPGCGAVKVVPADETVAADRRVNVFLNACKLLRIDEVQRPLGRAFRFQHVWLGLEEASTCEFTGGLNGAAAELVVSPARVKPEPFATRTGRRRPNVPGVARFATWADTSSRCCPSGVLSARTREGVEFELVLYGRPVAALRHIAIGLGRVVAQRIAAQFPGDRSALPRPAAPPLDPCRIITAAEQVRQLGWSHAVRSNPSTTWSADPVSESDWRRGLRDRDEQYAGDGHPSEYAGGPGGGSWQCIRWRFAGAAENSTSADFEVHIFKHPVSPREVVASPIRLLGGLDREAFIVAFPPVHAVPWEQGRRAAVFFRGAGGRLIGLYLRDIRLDAATHDRHLVALARLVTFRVGR